MHAKAGLIDHFSPGRLQLSYIAKQQIFNSDFRWSICPANSGQAYRFFQPSVNHHISHTSQSLIITRSKTS
jgi:hypothetical protein